MHRRTAVALLLTVLFLLGALSAAQNAPITLNVDAREAPRRVFHARLTFPVVAGPLTLYYPKWLPGNHRPTGPIANVVGLRFSAGGQVIPWNRDDVDMYAFHVNVPTGASTLEASFDYVTPSHGPGRFDPVSTDQLMILNWNVVLLYPAGKPVREFTYSAKMELPTGWKFGTALPVSSHSGDSVAFAPVPLNTLVDSPVLAGANYRAVPLSTTGAPPQELDIAGDSAAALEISDELLPVYRNLMAEASVLFGAHHYRDYHFLLTLSDVEPPNGLEHHESSDDRAPERTLIDPNLRKLMAGLLPHEFVHSWNGKYRRPTGLATSDYQQPMKGELLWIYEGLTTYLGEVLTARSNLYTPQQFREQLALTASEMSHRAGRIWRPLEDTAVSAQILYEAPTEWTAWRRSADFYPESELIWLEADTIIRQQTNGRRSLDDFCRAFEGPPSGPPEMKPYTLDDVVAALNQVAAYDWRGFFQGRVFAVAPQAPLGGIEQGGWRLVYNDTPNELLQAEEKFAHGMNLTSSIGMVIRQEKKEDEGTIVDVIPGMAAAAAGIAPGMKLMAINGRKWSPEVLLATLKDRGPLQLLMENIGYYRTYSVNYHDGPRFPHLERVQGRADVLGEIVKSRASQGTR
ncbi:MAG TPA: M61 family peptidase [Terriglobales bacterium]|nr:M61 family peptidase [Terriglobales bacterium]